MRCLRFLILALCLAAAGCVSSGTAPVGRALAPNDLVDETDPRIMIIYGNEEFRDKVRVVRKILDDSGTLAKCSVTLQNVSQDTFIVEYQFRWMEQSGMPVMQTPAWHRVTLAPNAVKPLIAVAKTPEAKTVEFTVRLPLTALYQPPEKK